MTKTLLAATALFLLCTISLGDEPKAEALEGRGVVVPVKRVTIASTVPGQVVEVHVQPGQQVKRGEVLVRLEGMRQESEVKRAELQFQGARARLDHLKIVEKGNTTDAARIATEIARIAVETAQVERDRARLELDSRAVRAPFEGMILQVNGEVGSFTDPANLGLASASSLCELADLSAPLVEVTLPESAFGQVTPGMKCEATLTVLRGKKLQGIVERVGPTIDPLRSNFTVRVRLTAKEVLPIGASAQVRFALKQ